MQCNDVFMLRCDMTQLGIDQRKVNMLAREYCDYPDNGKVLSYLGKDDKGNCHKPVRAERHFPFPCHFFILSGKVVVAQVILSHHMLAGLKGFKMSKSDPDAAIFMEDTEAEVNRKIKKAYCPEKLLQEETVNDKGVKETKTNGCIEYVKYLVLPKMGKFEVEFQAGGSKTYTQFEEVVADYTDGAHSSKLTVSCSHSFSQSNSVPYVWMIRHAAPEGPEGRPGHSGERDAAAGAGPLHERPNGQGAAEEDGAVHGGARSEGRGGCQASQEGHRGQGRRRRGQTQGRRRWRESQGRRAGWCSLLRHRLGRCDHVPGYPRRRAQECAPPPSG